MKIFKLDKTWKSRLLVSWFYANYLKEQTKIKFHKPPKQFVNREHMFIGSRKRKI